MTVILRKGGPRGFRQKKPSELRLSIVSVGPSGLAVISLLKQDSLLVFEYTGKLKRFLQDNGDVMSTLNLLVGS